MPSDDMRLPDEEIKSAVEYERESMTSGTQSLSVVKEEDEFTFESSREMSSNGSMMSSKGGSPLTRGFSQDE